MPDSREVAGRIIDLVFHTPRIDADSPLEEIHLLESIADIVDDALIEQERETRQEVEDELTVQPQFEDTNPDAIGAYATAIMVAKPAIEAAQPIEMSPGMTSNDGFIFMPPTVVCTQAAEAPSFKPEVKTEYS